jgi:hypothetical protein
MADEHVREHAAKVLQRPEGAQKVGDASGVSERCDKNLVGEVVGIAAGKSVFGSSDKYECGDVVVVESPVRAEPHFRCRELLGQAGLLTQKQILDLRVLFERVCPTSSF